jgi:hypothetical protein
MSSASFSQVALALANRDLVLSPRPTRFLVLHRQLFFGMSKAREAGAGVMVMVGKAVSSIAARAWAAASAGFTWEWGRGECECAANGRTRG